MIIFHRPCLWLYPNFFLCFQQLLHFFSHVTYYLFRAFLPDISTAVAAPIVAPLSLQSFHKIMKLALSRYSSAIYKCNCRYFVSNIASFICVAASNRPPKVSISKMIAAALFSALLNASNYIRR